MKRIAIAGNPNSGKTTIFNLLSGRNEKIGNWAGVTVAKKEAPLRKKYNISNEGVMIVDLPGAYGLDAYTNDELEATEFLKNEKIDSIINVVDASNLERSLFLTTQLIDTGIPVVIALNKADITRRRRTKIDVELLGEKLGVSVHFTQATSKKGMGCIVGSALKSAGADILDTERGRHRYGRKQRKRHQKDCLRSRKQTT
jgi:ferrous iron transport protein B